MSRLGVVFTSPSYWLDAIARSLIVDGDMGRLGDSWVVGMGVALQAFEEAASRLGAKEISGSKARWVKAWIVGDVVLISLVGGHGYVEAILALAQKRGIRFILGLGLCGSLSQDLGIGDLVIPYAMVREDGLTDHYVEPNYPAVAHPLLLSKLYNYLESRGWKPRLVIGVSRSSILTESKEWVERMSNLRVICVDVETSTLYTLSTLIGVPAVAALIVSDNLVKEESALGTKPLRDIETSLVIDMTQFAMKTRTNDSLLFS